MKKTLTLLLFFFAIAPFVSAQNQVDITDEQVAMLASRELCDCFNETCKGMDIHPINVSMIMNIDKLGQEQASQQFTADLMGYGVEEQEQIIRDTQKMQNFNLQTTCKDVISKYGNFQGEAYQAALMKYLNDSNSCELIATFLRIGSK